MAQLPASNSNRSHGHDLRCSLTNQLLHFTSLHFTSLNWTALIFNNCPGYKISVRTAQKTEFLNVVAQLLRWEHICLRSCYSVTALLYILHSRSLPSDRPTCYDTFWSHPRTRHNWNNKWYHKYREQNYWSESESIRAYILLNSAIKRNM
jgi:hypothetical protein